MKKYFLILILAVFILSACSGTPQNTTANNSEQQVESVEPTATDIPAATATSEPASEASATEESMAEEAETEDTAETMDLSHLPNWYGYTFTDAVTGETFSINDYHGKVVIVEMMAMWCSNCMKQQREVVGLLDSLGERDDLVMIAIDVDLNEQLGQLGAYAQSNGFDWQYGIVNQDIAREIAQLYGNEFLTPPFTPMLIIDQEGNSTILPFSHKTADTILSYLDPLLNQ